MHTIGDVYEITHTVLQLCCLDFKMVSFRNSRKGVQFTMSI